MFFELSNHLAHGVAFGFGAMRCSAGLLACLLFFCCRGSEARTDVFFTPSPDCEIHIAAAADRAERSVDAAVYALTNARIAAALKRAAERGVTVRILADRLQAAGRFSRVAELRGAGVDVHVHFGYKTEHNKFAVFDGKSVVTGSYNWTENASRNNSENCLFVFDDDVTVKRYFLRFEELWQLNSADKSWQWFESHSARNAGKKVQKNP